MHLREPHPSERIDLPGHAQESTMSVAGTERARTCRPGHAPIAYPGAKSPGDVKSFNPPSDPHDIAA